jgi:hypothetical protein
MFGKAYEQRKKREKTGRKEEVARPEEPETEIMGHFPA